MEIDSTIKYFSPSVIGTVLGTQFLAAIRHEGQTCMTYRSLDTSDNLLFIVYFANLHTSLTVVLSCYMVSCTKTKLFLCEQKNKSCHNSSAP